jgi:hypothetical protein
MLAGALALALISAVPAATRPAYARVKCAGTYSTIVNVPDPHADARPAGRAHAPMHRAAKSLPHADASAGGEGAVLRRRASRLGDQILPHPAGCPSVAFCGCGAAIEVFGRSVRALWRAAAWLAFPPAAPAPGMAAVRQHHVMIIREYLGDGRALVYDANSGGHLTRVHVVSLRGYRIRNPRGA